MSKQSLILIQPKKTDFDPIAQQVRSDLLEWGAGKKEADAHTVRLYRIEGDVSAPDLDRIADALLVDAVVETALVEEGSAPPRKAPKKKSGVRLDVWLKPGVTDPVSESVEKGIKDLGITVPVHASTGIRYVLPHVTNDTLINRLKKSIANELIHHVDRTDF